MAAAVMRSGRANFRFSSFSNTRIGLSAFAFNDLSKARFEEVNVINVSPRQLEDKGLMPLDDLVRKAAHLTPVKVPTTYGDKVVVGRRGDTYRLTDLRATDDIPYSDCPERPI
jgi:hypothetical protein